VGVLLLFVTADGMLTVATDTISVAITAATMAIAIIFI
jgi:hypothetical protein